MECAGEEGQEQDGEEKQGVQVVGKRSGGDG